MTSRATELGGVPPHAPPRPPVGKKKKKKGGRTSSLDEPVHVETVDMGMVETILERRKTHVPFEAFQESRERRSTILALLKSRPPESRAQLRLSQAASQDCRSPAFRSLQFSHLEDFDRMDAALVKILHENAQCCTDYLARFINGMQINPTTALTFTSLDHCAQYYYISKCAAANGHYTGHGLFNRAWWFRRIKNPKKKNNTNEDLQYEMPNLSKPLQTTGYRITLDYMRVDCCEEALFFYNEAADLREAYEDAVNKLIVAGGDLDENRRLVAGYFVKYCKGFKKVYNKRIRIQPGVNFEDYRPGDEIPKVESEINVKGPTRQECANVMNDIVTPFLASLRTTDAPNDGRDRTSALTAGPTTKAKKKKKTGGSPPNR